MPVGRKTLVHIVQTFIESIGRLSVFKDGSPGTDWIQNFEKRNAHILTRRKPEILTLSRAKSLTVEVRDAFFKLWLGVLNENDLLEAPDRIFNLDETGLNTDSSSRKVYTKKGVRDVYMMQPTAGKTMYTVLFCASAGGEYLPPMVVYKAKKINLNWVANGPDGAVYSVSESGYMHDYNFEQWFRTVFVKHVANYEKPIVLTYDGHGSHLTYQTVKAAKENSIIIVCLPPHTSHALQPLDVACFKSVKEIWTNVLGQYYKETRSKMSVDKERFPMLLAKLWKRLKPENIIGGFRGSGLFPVDKHQVDNRIVGLKKADKRPGMDESSESLPTPRKAIRDAIVATISPGEPLPKKQKRRRVQHSLGEVMTHDDVIERLRTEEIERANKKKKESLTKKVAKKIKNNMTKKTQKSSRRELFVDVSSDEDIADPKLARKEKTNKWSSEGQTSEDDFDWDFYDEPAEFVENTLPSMGAIQGGTRVNVRREKWEVSKKDFAEAGPSGVVSGPGHVDTSDESDDEVVEGSVGEEDDEDDGQKIRENVTFVIVDYEGSKFPGLVVKTKKKGYLVKCMVKSGIRQWKFPEKDDICDYDPDQIVQVIKPPAITNNRNAMSCPEIDKYWNEG